jgi:hypothetical protein
MIACFEDIDNYNGFKIQLFYQIHKKFMQFLKEELAGLIFGILFYTGLFFMHS